MSNVQSQETKISRPLLTILISITVLGAAFSVMAMILTDLGMILNHRITLGLILAGYVVSWLSLAGFITRIPKVSRKSDR